MEVSADVILGPGGEAQKAEARRAFEERGFAVQDVGASLVIEGEPEAFERLLGVGVEVNEDPAPGEAVATASGEPRLPDEMRELVETVAFPKRAHLFSGNERKSNG